MYPVSSFFFFFFPGIYIWVQEGLQHLQHGQNLAAARRGSHSSLRQRSSSKH
jgi:hypothetical protein